jgi:hypothetical protein
MQIMFLAASAKFGISWIFALYYKRKKDKE